MPVPDYAVPMPPNITHEEALRRIARLRKLGLEMDDDGAHRLAEFCARPGPHPLGWSPLLGYAQDEDYPSPLVRYRV